MLSRKQTRVLSMMSLLEGRELANLCKSFIRARLSRLTSRRAATMKSSEESRQLISWWSCHWVAAWAELAICSCLRKMAQSSRSTLKALLAQAKRTHLRSRSTRTRRTRKGRKATTSKITSATWSLMARILQTRLEVRRNKKLLQSINAHWHL